MARHKTRSRWSISWIPLQALPARLCLRWYDLGRRLLPAAWRPPRRDASSLGLIGSSFKSKGVGGATNLPTTLTTCFSALPANCSHGKGHEPRRNRREGLWFHSHLDRDPWCAGNPCRSESVLSSPRKPRPTWQHCSYTDCPAATDRVHPILLRAVRTDHGSYPFGQPM